MTTLKHGCCVDRRWRERNPDVGGAPNGCTPATCMELPDGATCGDCVYWSAWCEKFFGGGSRTADTTSCDWFPRRFVDARQL